MEIKLSFSWYLLFVLLGIFQALFLCVVIFVKGRTLGSRFRYLSLLLLSLSIVLTEVFLNYSGYIFHVIHLHKFSFPVQFLIAPSLFLFIRNSLFSKPLPNLWVHFIPFLIILLYFTLYYIQDTAPKFNLLIEEQGLEQEKVAVKSAIPYDPLKVFRYLHNLVFAHLLIYALFLWRVISRRYRSESVKIWNIQKHYLNQYRNLLVYYLLAILIMAWLVFRYFWLGDYLFSLYLTCIVYLISINISYKSLNEYFRKRQLVKYARSTLSAEEKASILNKIKQVAEEEDFFSRGNASLEVLSGSIKVSKHHVSQVVNELLGKSFFEYLAELRVGKAKALLMDPDYQNVTIDEISFLAGYNSRSAFNRVFKSITGTTPAEFRRKSH